MEGQSRVQLPPGVGDSYQVYVNGVLQTPGRDFDRLGEGMLPDRESVIQEGDMLHLVMREENAGHAYAIIEEGPEDD